jgi:hypothetical protein
MLDEQFHEGSDYLQLAALLQQNVLGGVLVISIWGP